VAYSYVLATETAERVIVKSKLAKTVAVEVQISTAFVVLAIPATTVPAPEYLVLLAGVAASAITPATRVMPVVAITVVYTLESLTILIHFVASCREVDPRADEVTAAARLA